VICVPARKQGSNGSLGAVEPSTCAGMVASAMLPIITHIIKILSNFSFILPHQYSNALFFFLLLTVDKIVLKEQYRPALVYPIASHRPQTCFIHPKIISIEPVN